MADLCTTTARGSHPWTATSLLSAFFELVIAFLFLAGATITYFTSKFIKIFGLSLPCFERGGGWIERQSDVRRYAFLHLVSREVRALSNYFLHRTFAEDRSPCEQSSSSTSGSEKGRLNAPKPMSANQLSFHRRRHRLQTPRHCLAHRHSDALSTVIFDEATALRSEMQRNNAGLLLNRESLNCDSSRRRRSHSGKRKLGSLSLDVSPHTDRVSDDTGNRADEAEDTHLEREHSLKVFPEECIEFDALIQGHHRDEVMGRPRDPGKLSGGLNLRLLAEGISHGCTHICGGASPSEPARDSVEENCPFAVVDFSDSHRTEKRIERKPVNAQGNRRDSLDDHDERGTNSVQSEGQVYSGDARTTGVACESDEDVLELKEKLAAERELLNRTYLELEKERIASASAADEAISLITRLQEDKAALQMEAVQSQRIAEERAMFDEEAIVTLRDTLLKREAEKLALEKEIELYRRKLLMGVLEAGEKRIKEEEATHSSGSEDDIQESMRKVLRNKRTHRKQSLPASDAILAEVFGVKGESNIESTNTNFSLLSGNADLPEPFEFMIDDGSSSEQEAVVQNGKMNHHNPGGDCSPVTVKDAHHEYQSDDLVNFQQLQSSGLKIAPASSREQSEATKRKLQGSPDKQWQQVLSRIRNLEEQITNLKTKDKIMRRQHFEAMSCPSNAKDLVQVILRNEKTGWRNIKHDHSAAKQIASRKFSGLRDPGKRIMRAKSETDIFPSMSKRCRTSVNHYANRTASCEMDLTSNGETLGVLEGNFWENNSCRAVSLPNPFSTVGVTLEDAQMPEKKLITETGSRSSCSSLGDEAVLEDEKGEAIDDLFSEISKYSLPESVVSESYISSITTRDKYRYKVQEEINKIMYRLQMVEADRGILKQAIDSIKREMGAMEQLLDIAHQVRLLLTSPAVEGASENPEQPDNVLCDSAVEVGKPPFQKH